MSIAELNFLTKTLMLPGIVNDAGTALEKINLKVQILCTLYLVLKLGDK